MNDALFAAVRSPQKKTIDLNEIADDIKIDEKKLLSDMASTETMQKIMLDICQGLKHEITGTPAFVIDAQVYTGVLPPEILAKNLK